MGRVTLPSGGWVELRDPALLRVRDRKQVLRSAEGAGIDATMASAEMVMALAVAKWSFDLPVPSDDMTVLDGLEIGDYDAIAEAAQPFTDALFPSSVPKAT